MANQVGGRGACPVTVCWRGMLMGVTCGASGRAVTPVAEKSGGPRPRGLSEWAKWLVCALDMWSVFAQSEECGRAWTKWLDRAMPHSQARRRNLGRASRVAFGKDSGDSQVDLGQPEGHGGSLPRLSSTVVSHCGASRGAVLSN
ncbi:hypothetical protein TIFTF001_045903 [Ficus carica]|uniref:Uncharacterized protein n=1 Tax=Ficus carica TaxID=3494 RepID=A0AA88CPR2_FICCA|nr:hypothetical protein TIFTF001_045903 [Ficus carica]